MSNKQNGNEVENEEKENLVTTCGICLERNEYGINELECKHFYCYSCLTRYICDKIKERRTPIKCPHYDCNLIFDYDIINFIDNEELLLKFTELELIQKMPNDCMYCPDKNCSELLIVDADTNFGLSECPYCDADICATCRVEWHNSYTCDQYQTIPLNEREVDDHLFYKLSNEKKWNRCEQCKYIIEKSEGCNHIVCSCGHEFCYVCGNAYENEEPSCSCGLYYIPTQDNKLESEDQYYLTCCSKRFRSRRQWNHHRRNSSTCPFRNLTCCDTLYESIQHLEDHREISSTCPYRIRSCFERLFCCKNQFDHYQHNAIPSEYIRTSSNEYSDVASVNQSSSTSPDQSLKSSQSLSQSSSQSFSSLSSSSLSSSSLSSSSLSSSSLSLSALSLSASSLSSSSLSSSLSPLSTFHPDLKM